MKVSSEKGNLVLGINRWPDRAITYLKMMMDWLIGPWILVEEEGLS